MLSQPKFMPAETQDSRARTAEDRLIALLDRRNWCSAAALIQSGADLHYGNGYALRTAVACNAPTFAQWLIDRGANPEVCEIEAWQDVIQQGSLGVLKVLIKASPPDRLRAELLIAFSAQEGKVKSLRCLLDLDNWSPKGMEAAVLAADRRQQEASLEVIFEDMLTRHGWPYVQDFISLRSWPNARSVVRSLQIEAMMAQLEPLQLLSSRRTSRHTAS